MSIIKSKELAEQLEYIIPYVSLKYFDTEDKRSDKEKIVKKEDFIKNLPKDCKVKYFCNGFYAEGDIVTHDLRIFENYIIKDFKEDGTPLVSKFVKGKIQKKTIEYNKDFIIRVARLKLEENETNI